MAPNRRHLHFWRDRAGHEVDFLLEQEGKLVALENKNSSEVTLADAAGLQAFQAALKRKQTLVRSVVLHAGKARPLGAELLALPWNWMVPRA